MFNPEERRNKAEKLFLDCEFSSLAKDTQLISIGLVADNGKFFYAELSEVNLSKLDSWLQKNVVSELLFRDKEVGFIEKTEYSVLMKNTKIEVAEVMEMWLSSLIRENEKLLVVTDCGVFDWLLLIDIFGSAFELPESLHPAPHDLFSMLIDFGYSPKDAWNLNRARLAGLADESYQVNEIVDLCYGKKHNALWDAHQLSLVYRLMLKSMKNSGSE